MNYREVKHGLWQGVPVARPLKPTFSIQEVQEFILPMAKGPLRLVSQRAPDGELVATSEAEKLIWVMRAESTVLALAQTDEVPAYSIGADDTIMPSAQLRQLGADWWTLEDAVKPSPGLPHGDKPHFCLPPRLQAFYDAFAPLFEAGYGNDVVGRSRKPLWGLPLREFDRLLKAGMSTFQSQVRARETEREVRRLRARLSRNRQQQQTYLDALLERHGSLFVVRLDLGYDPHHVACMRQLTLVRAKHDFANFARERRFHAMWKDDLVGLIWKLEDSAERRFHFHLLLFYRGDCAEHHTRDRALLQRRWIDEITHGDGAAYDSWDCPEETPMGVAPEGLVTGKDSDTYHAIRCLLDHLSRIDQLLRLKVPKGTNGFGRGHLPGSRRPGRRSGQRTLNETT